MGLAVYLHQPPHAAFLTAWGRHATGWWGCLTMRVRLVDVDEELAVAAWVPSQAFDRQSWAAASGDIPRITLPDEQRSWPAPPRWPSWYAGPWPTGPLPLPPGTTMVAGAAWRKRPPRAAT